RPLGVVRLSACSSPSRLRIVSASSAGLTGCLPIALITSPLGHLNRTLGLATLTEMMWRSDPVELGISSTSPWLSNIDGSSIGLAAVPAVCHGLASGYREMCAGV